MRLAAPTVLLLGVTGCWFRLGVDIGAVDLSWTFNRGENCVTAGVTQVAVTVGGKTTVFPCDQGLDGGMSGVLTDAPAGDQTLVLEGIGNVYDPDAGAAIPKPAYRTTYVLDVAEESTNFVPLLDLPPIALDHANGTVQLLWSFGGLTCAETGVDLLELVLDGTATLAADMGGIGFFPERAEVAIAPCQAGGQDGVRLGNLKQVLYSFPVAADAGDGSVFVAAPTVYVTGFTESVQHVDLHPDIEEQESADTLTLEIHFTFGPEAVGCQDAGVDHVLLQLARAVAAGAGDTINNEPAPVDFGTVPLPDQSTGICPPDGHLSFAISTTGNFGTGTGLSSPCDSTTAASGLCVGEYFLSAQAVSQSGAVLYQIANDDLWVDEGFGTAGVYAGFVDSYGDPSRSTVANIHSVYRVNLPAVSPEGQ